MDGGVRGKTGRRCNLYSSRRGRDSQSWRVRLSEQQQAKGVINDTPKKHFHFHHSALQIHPPFRLKRATGAPQITPLLLPLLNHLPPRQLCHFPHSSSPPSTYPYPRPHHFTDPHPYHITQFHPRSLKMTGGKSGGKASGSKTSQS